mgnify:CR=1 FL=1
MKKYFDDSRIIVIKVGSSLVANQETSAPNIKWLASLAEDVADLKKKNKQVIIVTSGAVALGRKVLGVKKKILKLQEKQAAAACGQLSLVSAYQECFSKHKMNTAQVLLTLEDSEDRRRYLNARNTIETLLDAEIIPVINENDTVATAEIKFGDNDRLAARVAQMVGANLLILLSDIDGLYTSDPNKNKNAEHIKEVVKIDEKIEKMAAGSVSEVGSGGMVTKISAAKIAVSSGCHTIITLGKNNNPVSNLFNGEKNTIFISKENPDSAKKRWIADGLTAKGSVVVDDGAVQALKNGKSLLPAGVVKVEGEFDRGDTIMVKTKDNKEIARGLSTYSSEDAKKIIGSKSEKIPEILGFLGRDELIHRDDMVIK